MQKKIPGVTKVDKTKTDSTPLQLHDNAKANKYGSPEFNNSQL